jgi:flagellar hook assembly protein FlgD
VLGLLTADTDIVPSDFKIYQNYPNPFNPTTFLSFNMEREGLVSVTINDIQGRIVKTLLNGPQVPGYNTVQWNATSDSNELVSAGTYFYTVRVEGQTKSKKITLLK